MCFYREIVKLLDSYLQVFWSHFFLFLHCKDNYGKGWKVVWLCLFIFFSTFVLILFGKRKPLVCSLKEIGLNAIVLSIFQSLHILFHSPQLWKLYHYNTLPFQSVGILWDKGRKINVTWWFEIKLEEPFIFNRNKILFATTWK